jgi:hypothetical protein
VDEERDDMTDDIIRCQCPTVHGPPLFFCGGKLAPGEGESDRVFGGVGKVGSLIWHTGRRKNK